MKGLFYSNQMFIGELDYSNEVRNKTEIGMEGICGYFSPNENYDLIRDEVQEWNDSQWNNSQKRDWSKWYSLNFNVQLENGYFLLPEGGYEIYDYKDFPEEPLQVITAGIHSHIFEDYFIQNKPFLKEPWRKITIEEKFNLEEKYQKETSLVKKLSFFLNYFYEPKFSALAFNEKTEEVLFATSWVKTGCFSIVNFAQKDEKGNPKFEFYNSFGEFLEPERDNCINK